MLLDIVKKIQVTKTYFIEKITQEYCSESGKNIQVIRLPIAHSELNPIELIWANVKNQVAKRNVTFKMTDVKRLVNEALANVTPENWKDAVNHTIKVEDEYWEMDFGSSCPIVEEFIININESSGESEDDEFE